MVRVRRRLAAHVDWLLVLLVAAIVGMGIATLYSATYLKGQLQPSPLATRQVAWAGVGVLLFLFSVAFDYRRLERWAYPLYGLTLALLAVVPIIGVIGGGSRRWVDFGFFSVQPSELAKLALVVALARYFHEDKDREAYAFHELIVPALLFLIPAALIVVQPDLGSAVLLALVFGTVVAVAGLRMRSVVYALALVAVIGIYAGESLWSQLKPYQQQRILTFLDPETDPLGAGYHVIQSQIAIGSGGTWGKGFLEGTQNQLRFLPEQHTDFIFSVFAEEWGLVGTLVLMALYLALVLRGLQITLRAKDRFGALLAFGVTAILFWQAFVNIAMAVGAMPVVGITLPLFSYGGSSMVTLLVGTGLMTNVAMRRFLF